MKDYLLDLIQHTHGLGVVDLVKIVGTDTETLVSAVSDDKTVIVNGTFKAPIAEFIGTFGMPNLSKLRTILSFDDYDDTSTINVGRGTKEDPQAPASIHFETKTGDFVNDYRLMSKTLVEDKIKKVTFNGAGWDVSFDPSIAGVQRLKKQSSVHSEDLHFKTKTENNNLVVYFGDPSSHSGNFVFQSGVSGSLARPWNWPVKVFLAIMDLPGDKTVSFSDQGVAQIVVDNPISKYHYYLPAQAK
jgi:hypothetical protein